MPNGIFLQLIAIGKEQRNIEYKQSTNWSGEFRAKIVKSILSMSNIRDGGDIMIGMEKQADDTYIPRGMEQAHLNSYTADNIGRFVAEYADPYARFDLKKEEDKSGKMYVWIRVYPFEETPVICRKSHNDILSGGKLYTRTRRIPESAEVPSSAEMRETIAMATDRELAVFLRRLNAAGIQFPVTISQTDEQKFTDQIRGVF